MIFRSYAVERSLFPTGIGWIFAPIVHLVEKTWLLTFFSPRGQLGLVMKKGIANQHNPDLLDEYDFSQGVQGKYVRKYGEGTNIVRLDDDVAQIFPDAKSVNKALRSLEKSINQHKQKV